MTSPCPLRAARGLPRSPLHDTRPPEDGRPADLGAALPSDPAHLRASLSIPVLEHSGAALRLYVPETHRSCRPAPARSGRARGRGSAALPRSVRPIFARNCRPARHQLATVPGPPHCGAAAAEPRRAMPRRSGRVRDPVLVPPFPSRGSRRPLFGREATAWNLRPRQSSIATATSNSAPRDRTSWALSTLVQGTSALTLPLPRSEVTVGCKLHPGARQTP